ncbi:MAG: stage 0 sporulation family protein [Roseiflexaceae bacterium]
MPVVVGIRFKDSGKIYFFDPNGLTDLEIGQGVVVETVRGPELAKISNLPHEVGDDDVVGELKPVIRLAESADYERLKVLNARQHELLERCAEKIAEHSLPMRLVKAEYSFDGSRLTFYFTAEKRVDFRMLVRDLARLFRARIELRQIGPRDEAKLLGGIGPCGRMLCCATFLPDYARVSIKMAKDQDLPLNPTKISGVCGRLLCCLSYEHEQYLQIKAELPKKGAWVQTPDGPGEVIAVNVVRETVMVELAGSQAHEEFTPAQITVATDRVANLARSRNDEGITPAALLELERDTPLPPTPLPAAQRRPPERKPPEPRPNRGERRLLRDEIDNPEVLEALAMLEDGPEEQHPRASERRPQPKGEQPAPAAPNQSATPPRRSGPPQPNRRPQPPQRRPQQPPASASAAQPPRTEGQPPRPPRQELPDLPPLEDAEEAPERPPRPGQPPRRRRRKG